MIRPPPCSPLFPYTTLFRSETGVAPVDWCAQDHRAVAAALLPESHPGLSIGLRILRVTHRNRCPAGPQDRKSTRLNSSHVKISYAVFCLKKKKKYHNINYTK